MTEGPVLRAAGSHLYPGARGRIAGTLPGARTPCLVEFADGAATAGSLVREDGGFVLEAGPYTTARGTPIPAKRWRILAEAGAFRVLRRA